MDQMRRDERRVQAVIRVLCALGSRAYRFEDRQGAGFLTVTRNTRAAEWRGVKLAWRCTWFFESGEPYGHIEAATLADAINEARHHGAKLR